VSGGTISGSTGFFSSTLTAFGSSQLQAVDAVSINCTANVQVMGTHQVYGPTLLESVTCTSVTVASNVQANGTIQANGFNTPVEPNLNSKISGLLTLMSDAPFPTSTSGTDICGLQLFRNNRASIGELDMVCQARLGTGGGFNFWSANLTQTPVLQAYIEPTGLHACGNLYHGSGGTTNATSQINTLLSKTTGLSYSSSNTTIQNTCYADNFVGDKVTSLGGFFLASSINYSTFAPQSTVLGYNVMAYGLGTQTFTQSDEASTVWNGCNLTLPAGIWRVEATHHYGITSAANRDYCMQMCISQTSATFSVAGSKQFAVSQLIPGIVTQTDVTLQNSAIFTLTASTTLYLVARLTKNYTGTVTTGLVGAHDWTKSGLIATRLC
jgi:hypothetical protein